MIGEFLHSWALFGNTYLAAWLLAALLALIGVMVVARNQIFAGAALAQVSTLGIAGAMWVGACFGPPAAAWMESQGALTGIAIGGSVLASVFTLRTRGQRRESRETLTGWLFLLGASGSIVIVSHSPHGMEEVQRLVSSSIIGASLSDVWIFGAMLVVSMLVVARWRRTLLLWVMDPAMASACGVRIGVLETALAVWLGVCVGLSLRSAGMLYTFGMLVIPAMIARSWCREVRSMLVVAPIVGVLCAISGFVVANHYDYPPGQLTVAGGCLLIPLSWLRHRGGRI